jgi:hypothetical protein
MSIADTVSSSAGNRYQEHADMFVIRRGTFRMGSRSTASAASPEKERAVSCIFLTMSNFDHRNPSERCKLLLSPSHVGGHWVSLSVARSHLCVCPLTGTKTCQKGG